MCEIFVRASFVFIQQMLIPVYTPAQCRLKLLLTVCINHLGTFINISLFCKNKRVQSKKTEMKTRKAEIFFYEKFSFLVQKGDIRECSLHCHAVHKVGSFIKRDHVIGEVLIGGDDACDGDGLRHWEEMLRRPKKNVTQWYYIQEG